MRCHIDLLSSNRCFARIDLQDNTEMSMGQKNCFGIMDDDLTYECLIINY